MPKSGVVPGFRFDAKRKRAFFEVILPGTRGRVRRRRVVKVSTRDEALALFGTFRTAALAERLAEPKLFSDFVARFWPLIKMRLGRDTAAQETAVVEKILKPFFGAYRLDKINGALVQDFVASLRSRSYAGGTINRTVSVLRKILNDAVAREVIDSFPVRGRLPRTREPTLKLELSDDERARFLRAFDDEAQFRGYFAEHRSAGKIVSSPHFAGGPRAFGGGPTPNGAALGVHFHRFRAMRPLFVVALETGLRRGDLLALKWTSVDFAEAWIRVSVRKTSREALIPISQACRRALIECRGSVRSERVFVTDEGRPLSWSTVHRHFDLAKKLAGISRRFRFHDLRHTFGSTLASRGVSLQVIAKALGHASVRMSERYARPSEEALQQIRRALDGPGGQNA